MQIPEYVNEFLNYCSNERGLSLKTRENYSRFLKKFLDWLQENRLSHLKPHELTLDHIQQYKHYLKQQNHTRDHSRLLKQKTQNYYLIALRAFLSYFARQNIHSLPPEKITLDKDRSERVVRFLSLDQLERLFSVPNVTTPQGLRDRAILETFFSTGTRISELVALNREQVKSSLNSDDLELGIVGRSGKTRTISFSPRTLQWLKRYLKTRNDKDRALFINYRGPTDAPRRLTPRSIEKSIQRYSLLAGLPPTTTPHVLRHSFATDLLSQGVDIRILQEFLGHKSITATQIYAHVTSRKLREVHRKFHSGHKLEK